MKSVLISIQPYWVFLIIARKMGWDIPQNKSVEIRKTCPKEKTWNKKAIIYCTQDKKSFYSIPKEYQGSMRPLLGKVIGEFVCDDISKFTAEFTDGKTYEDIRYCYLNEYEEEEEMIVVSNEWSNPNNSWICKESCLSFDDFKKYIGINFHNIPFYGWHISELKIYDMPKELSEVYNLCNESLTDRETAKCKQCLYHRDKNEMSLANDQNCACDGAKPLIRAPQSWCYVEETN